MAGTEPVAVAVVCDAGPLIHLDESGWLDLLADFREVLRALPGESTLHLKRSLLDEFIRQVEAAD